MSIIDLSSEPKLIGPNGHPLQAVVLECPYESILTNKKTHQVFPELLELKIRGYLAEYPYGVLPLETADFVANHIMICENNNGILTPQMAFKSITLDRCELHHLEFPIFHMVEAAKTEEERELYKKVIHSILSAAKHKEDKIGYNGSWTVSPAFRKMKGGLNFWEASMTHFANYYQSYGVKQILAAASIRFKVDEAKTFMGFSHLKDCDKRLPPIHVSSYNDEEVYVMHLDNFSKELLALCQKPIYKKLWEERLILSEKQATPKETAA